MDKKDIQEMIQEAVRGISNGLSADDVRTILKEEVEKGSKPHMKVEPDILADLSGRAQAVSDSCKLRVFDMALEARTQVEILNFINDEAVRGKSDATHKESAGDDAHDKTGDKDKVRSINDLSDDLFVNGFRAA